MLPLLENFCHCDKIKVSNTENARSSLNDSKGNLPGCSLRNGCKKQNLTLTELAKLKAEAECRDCVKFLH